MFDWKMCMSEIRPVYGINLRNSEYDIPNEQWGLMQNVYMTNGNEFEQIHGISKYHGTALDTGYSPTAIMPYYDTNTSQRHVLVAIGEKIYKKQSGSNEFKEVYDGLSSNRIQSSINLSDRGVTYIAHPEEGLLKYDGVDIEKVSGSPKLRQIIFSLETNRAFGILEETPLVLAYTDDVVKTQGVPEKWNALDLQAIPPTHGDELTKLDFMQGRLVLALQNSIYIQYIHGAVQNWRFEKIDSVVGCIAPKTWQKVGLERWFLGYTPTLGTGLYAFNGRTVRLLSYDSDVFLNRCNPHHIAESCAEVHDGYYWLSVPIDTSAENNYTLQVDIFKTNPRTESPVFYGPHTFGFQCSAVLHTQKFEGEFLIGKKRDNAGWVGKQDNVMTFWGDPMRDDGDLILADLQTGIRDKEPINGQIYDFEYVKRYKTFSHEFPTKGTWHNTVELYADGDNLVTKEYEQEQAGDNLSIDALFLGESTPNKKALGDNDFYGDVKGRCIKVRIMNHTKNTRLGFRRITYDARVVQKHKDARSTLNA